MVFGLLRETVAAEVDRGKREVRRAVLVAVRSFLLVGAALGMLLASLLFVMLGAYHSMVLEMPPWLAGVVVAAGALIVALLLLWLAALSGRRRRSRRVRAEARDRALEDAARREELQAAVEMGAAASAAAGTAARDFLSSHRPSSFSLTVSAFVVGLVMSRMSGRRESRRGRDAEE
jgi:MFS family permease